MIKSDKLIYLLPTAIIGILLVVSVMTSGFNFEKENKLALLSAEEAGQKALGYINETILEGQGSTSLKSIVGLDAGDLYKFELDVDGQTFDSYITRDGKFLFPQAIELEAQVESQEEDSSAVETSKRDLPDVKLFVMSYCPFGLQAQKAVLPVYDLLKDKADINMHFVDYIMHEKKEIDENLRQYCIQKENRGKFVEYLNCFVKEGDYEGCLKQTGLGESRIETCMAETDKKFRITEQYNDKSTWLSGRYPKFEVDAALNEKYNVGGSPTIVINDKVVDIDPRTPEQFKTVICQSFNAAPDECSQVLSSDTPSSGLGEGTGSSSGGSCQ